MIVNKNNIVIYPLKIYMGLTATSGLSMYTILLMYVSRSFFLSVVENENDLKIMKLLGDTQKRIIIEYAIQPIYYLLILLPVSAGISFKVAKQFIADFFDISDLQTVIQSFHIPLPLVISMIIICCLYVFISNFFKIRRLLKKWN
ncbi:hypothetical protein [Enterococcus sp. CWB-B31]|uniref:hypothetical protein n=1 Tax=Enterococcus sp. CWB-B31 TaxID=2885159 RepID=UPI001E62B18C|nr:hypothetical protein [Enterococcus sp. CWB-B31]MCB5955995.1 hypothetical protein [Enterococcus sp. CWB-B31]